MNNLPMHTAARLATLGMALLMASAGPVAAQPAGSSPPSALPIPVPAPSARTAYGWSARQSILGRDLFDAAGQRIGKVEDLIVDPHRNVSQLLVGVDSRIGRGWHVVAVPASEVVMKGERMVWPGATKASLALLPAFRYAPITRTQSQTVTRAEHDIDNAKARVTALAATAAGTNDGETKARMQRRILGLQTSQRAVEGKIAEMVAADDDHWQGLEAEVARASARLREAMKNPVN